MYLDRTNSSEFDSTSIRNMVGILEYYLSPVEYKRLEENEKASETKVSVRGVT